MSRFAKAAVLTASVGFALAGVTGTAVADADAEGVVAHSPGVLSGDVIQIPIHVPINLCGNSIDIVGLLNAASGNVCINS
ncbi:chaplin [Streptomyces orinoci]|uniref:Chaplin n=1 Tax=Streptomyces orinoci TaxID=67339 RepID=A0ABV3JQW4_STRON|nr:chaplin [Streptomyces orinoci]